MTYPTRIPWLAASALLLAACEYEPPLDTSVVPLLNRVSGEVVFGGGEEVATTFVLVNSADNLPPPAGLGSPVTFTAISADAFTGGGATLRSAPFDVTRLADGDYVFAAITDVDGDFQPFASALGGATCGDWGGAHLASLATTDFGPIHLEGGQAVEDVTILVGAQYSTERPAFQFKGGSQYAFTDLTGAFPKTFRIQATAVETAFSEDLELHLGPSCAPAADVPNCDGLPYCPCDAELPPCATALWAYMMDNDLDGVADPYPGEAQAEKGVLDVWPRVYLESTAVFETWEDADGVERPERWVAEAFPLLFELIVAQTTGNLPTTVLPLAVPVPANQLSVTMSSTFVHYHEGGAITDDPVNGPYDLIDLAVTPDMIEQMPAGDWSVTLVQFTGQTWTVPNEVGLLELPSLDPANFDPKTQAAALVFTK